MSDPINIPCPNCKSPAGDVCRTKGGKHRNGTCPQRERKAESLTETASNPLPVPAPAAARKTTAPVPTAPVVAPKGDDFDETTPPPKGRPKGTPIECRVVLPPGEDLAGIFAQWDREGRVPVGAALCEFVPISGKASKCKLLATVGPNPFGVKPGKEIPSAEAEPLKIISEIYRGTSRAQAWVILAPKNGGR